MQFVQVLSYLCTAGVAFGFSTKRSFNKNECGVEASNSPLHLHPWAVFLVYYRHGRERRTRCAGALITSQHVITAAHCVKVKYDRLVARLGEYNVSRSVDCVGVICAKPPVQAEVIRVTVHPGYHFIEHDLAILMLGEAAPYTDSIRPICLPTSALPNTAVFSAAGWGSLPSLGTYSTVKKHLALPYWSNKTDCERVLKKQLPSTVICAGGVYTVDTCSGDSGGPLTLKAEKHELFGITCAGKDHCGMKGMPAVYTNVKDHLDWIYSVVNI